MSMFWYMSQASGIPLLKSASFELHTSTAGESDTIIDSDYSNMSTSLDEDLEEQFVPDSDCISVLVDGVAQLIPDSEYISFWLDGEEHYGDASMEILYDMHSRSSVTKIDDSEELVLVQVEGGKGNLVKQLVAADMFGDEHELENGDVIEWDPSGFFGMSGGQWDLVGDGDDDEKIGLERELRRLRYLRWAGNAVLLCAMCFFGDPWSTLVFTILPEPTMGLEGNMSTGGLGTLLLNAGGPMVQRMLLWTLGYWWNNHTADVIREVEVYGQKL